MIEWQVKMEADNLWVAEANDGHESDHLWEDVEEDESDTEGDSSQSDENDSESKPVPEQPLYKDEYDDCVGWEREDDEDDPEEYERYEEHSVYGVDYDEDDDSPTEVLSEVKDLLEGLTDTLETVKMKLDNTMDKLENADTGAKEKDEVIANLVENLNETNAQLEAAKNTEKDMQKKIAGLQQELQTSKDAIVERDHQLSELREQLTKAKPIVDQDKEKHSGAVQQDHRTLDSCRAELEKCQAENERLRQDAKDRIPQLEGKLEQTLLKNVSLIEGLMALLKESEGDHDDKPAEVTRRKISQLEQDKLESQDSLKKMLENKLNAIEPTTQ